MEVELQILDYLKKKKYTKKYEGKTKPLTFGRSKKCDFTLSDTGISGVHCSLEFKDGEILLIDQDSSNGTIVQKKKISKIKLPLEERVTIGSHKFFVISFSDEEDESLEDEDFDDEELEDDDEYDEDEDYDDEETAIMLNPLEDPVNLIKGYYQGFFKKPVDYFDKVKLKNVQEKETLILIAGLALVTSLEQIISAPIFGVVNSAFLAVYYLGLSHVLDKSRGFTGFKGTRLQYLDFCLIYSAIFACTGIISIIPVVGFISFILLIVFTILGIKGFFRTFKAKFIQTFIVAMAYTFAIAIVYSPVATMLAPKAKVSKSDKAQTQNLINSILKSIPKQ